MTYQITEIVRIPLSRLYAGLIPPPPQFAHVLFSLLLIMNHKPSVRSLFAPNRGSTHRASSVSTVKRTSSITNAIRTASVGTAFVGNSRFHIALRTSNEAEQESNQNVKPSEVVAKESLTKGSSNRHSLVDKETQDNSNVRKSPFLSRRSPFITRRAKKNANTADNKGSEDAGNSSLETPSPKSDSKSEDRLSVSELFAVYSRITRRKVGEMFLFSCDPIITCTWFTHV